MDQIAFTIEIRDINGRRYVRQFGSRDDFYHWVVGRMNSETADEMEILLVTCDIGGSGQQILFSSLNNPFVGWGDLAGYLA